MADRNWALGKLNPAQQALFLAMRISDQAHAVRVARRLAQQAPPLWLIEAALLHDCGKPTDYGLLGRCAGVLLDPFLSKNLKGKGWRWLQIYRQHDAWSLEAAERAQSSIEALAFLRASQNTGAATPEIEAWLSPFQASDTLG